MLKTQMLALKMDSDLQHSLQVMEVTALGVKVKLPLTEEPNTLNSYLNLVWRLLSKIWIAAKLGKIGITKDPICWR